MMFGLCSGVSGCGLPTRKRKNAKTNQCSEEANKETRQSEGEVSDRPMVNLNHSYCTIFES